MKRTLSLLLSVVLVLGLALPAMAAEQYADVSGQSGTQGTITSKLSGATVLQGLAMQGRTAQALSGDGTNAAVKNWLDSPGLTK